LPVATAAPSAAGTASRWRLVCARCGALLCRRGSPGVLRSSGVPTSCCWA